MIIGPAFLGWWGLAGASPQSGQAGPPPQVGVGAFLRSGWQLERHGPLLGRSAHRPDNGEAPLVGPESGPVEAGPTNGRGRAAAQT
jgi:hypothetical protein